MGGRPARGTILRDHPLAPELVVLPTGFFFMGSPEEERTFDDEHFDDEYPQHYVRIRHPVALARWPVTRGAFARFADATGREPAGLKFYDGAWEPGVNKWRLDPHLSWRDPGFAQDDNHPVVGVDWHDARAYIAWLSARTGQAYRLPTEAEWEFAARAGTQTRFWWGDHADHAHANFDGAIGSTTPVGAFPANPFGLFDMNGNVGEWCQDAYSPTAYTDHTDYPAPHAPAADPGLRVNRGGSWRDGKGCIRNANRDGTEAETRSVDLGFRLARDLPT